jgi:TonB family protein
LADAFDSESDFSVSGSVKVKETHMLKRNRSLLQVLVLGIAFPLAAAPRAQTSATSIDTAISRLAARIANPLQKVHATKVVFADLKGPDGQTHPVGRWLSDQLANSCNKDFPGLEIIIRPQHEESAEGVDEAGSQKPAFQSVEEWARSVGANVFVAGTFASTADGIGISLVAFSSSDSPTSLVEAEGLVPVSEVIIGLSSEPIPALKDGVARAGVGGAGVPKCIYCPAPRYSGDARKAKVEGTVVLQVVVTTDGRATNVIIVKDPGKGLGLQAVESVRKWKFKPAAGPDGRPVAVTCPIEVTFRFF